MITGWAEFRHLNECKPFDCWHKIAEQHVPANTCTVRTGAGLEYRGQEAIVIRSVSCEMMPQCISVMLTNIHLLFFIDLILVSVFVQNS